jgi:hypothetical protein
MKHNFNFQENSKINPFDVPDGYFESFTEIMERKITPKKIPLYQKTMPYLYAAAMFLFIFIMGTIFVNNHLTKTPQSDYQPVIAYDEGINQMLMEEISEDAIIDYILNTN